MSEKELHDEINALKRGNTALIEALMDMVNQHCSSMHSTLLCDAGLSANEYAFSLLEEAGFVEYVPKRGYKLLYDKLEERMKLLA